MEVDLAGPYISYIADNMPENRGVVVPIQMGRLYTNDDMHFSAVFPLCLWAKLHS